MRTPETVAGMPCPVCKTALAMSERHGIEIDYCPNCRGIWLDRGELDKIIERSAAVETAPPAPPQSSMPPQPPAGYAPGYAPPPSPWGGQGYGGHGGHDRGYDPRYGKKRKKSFLEELFD